MPGARGQRKMQAPTKYRRCARCNAPVPLRYMICGQCGYDHSKTVTENRLKNP